ncbi:MAG: DUF1622 domain-containing protein [Methylobacterium sp.]|uniref:DUF1622 domain-containing protein n=1 Tax=Methylobacterium sp. TaxID=409 RepID=UPI0025FA3C3A|nr:DUF1622 domain-containing protein [Methylobacterium sp.]MBX9933567.1 DUF1622 domain-containing protein [Methylobacterium sp.]
MEPAEIFSNVEMRAPIIHVLHWIATTIEVIGVAAIVLGAIASTALFLWQGVGRGWEASFRSYRANLGRGILLGLEFLVAADIIGTVAVTPTFQSLGVLALIIAIRTFLSFSLQVEIEGQLPWRRREADRNSAGGPALN